MNLYKRNANRVISLSPLDIQNGCDSGLTKLTDTESERWVTGNYEIVDGVIVEKLAPVISILDQIKILEASITDRNRDEAILQDPYALNVIAENRAAIALLRAKL